MLHKESVLPRNEGVGCYCGGIVNWRTAVVHYVAKAVGLHVKVEGFPLGTSRNLDRQSVDCSPSQIGSGLGGLMYSQIISIPRPAGEGIHYTPLTGSRAAPIGSGGRNYLK